MVVMFGQLVRCLHMKESSPLTDPEFASLREVATGICHNAIPANHRARLLHLGLVYNLLGSLRINTAGRERINQGF